MSTAKDSSTSYRPLEGKIALVTGSSRGIGAGIAQNLASKGAKLILNYNSPSSSQVCIDLASKLTEKYGVQHLVVQADMGSLTGPGHIIETAVAKIPGLRLDIIVNNAGVSSNRNISDCTAEEFERVYSVNVRGPLLLMKASLPYLSHDRSGRIVNVSSISATAGLEGQSVYGGSKSALDAMTRTWARELANRATVNSINPGPVSTDMWNNAESRGMPDSLKGFIAMTPLGQVKEGLDEKIMYSGIGNARPACVDEVAGIVAMLVSTESAWCTGQVICANGGMRMSD